MRKYGIWQGKVCEGPPQIPSIYNQNECNGGTKAYRMQLLRSATRNDNYQPTNIAASLLPPTPLRPRRATPSCIICSNPICRFTISRFRRGAESRGNFVCQFKYLVGGEMVNNISSKLQLA